MNLWLLWIPATLIAAAAQTGRNATQRRLAERIGTVGATQVRFLYGFPFALVFLALVLAASGEAAPSPDVRFAAFVLGGAVAQILATALMLAAMRERSFSVVTALTKTEPVQVALFGLAVLGDRLTASGAVGIAVATAGVLLASGRTRAVDVAKSGLKPVVFGIAAGAFFALAAIGFRGAILSLASGSSVVRATTTLVWSLGAQTALLLLWLSAFDRRALTGSFAAWRSSLFAGFLGAVASQFWFIGFSLTAAANVRTLGLVEVMMAHAVSHRLLGQATSGRELAGMALIVVGVGLLLVGSA